MKQILRKIEPYENSSFSKTLKGQFDYFEIMFTIVRKILDNSSTMELSNNYKSDIPYLKLDIDKQSRVYVYLSADKFYSLSFPFHVEVFSKDHVVSIRSNNVELTNKIISEALGIINDVEKDSIFGTFEEMFVNSRYETDSSKLLENMWQYEPGYIRYDYDPQHNNGKIHPLNHLDINYSKKGHYKLGLNQRIDPQTFEDIINSQTECYFLHGNKLVEPIKLHKPDNRSRQKRNKMKKR